GGCVLEAERSVGTQLGLAGKRSASRCLPVDPHGSAGRAVDAARDGAALNGRRDAKRRPGGGLEPLEPIRRREEELAPAGKRARIAVEPSVELGERSAGVREHAGVDERVAERRPAVGADLGVAAVDEQRGEDPGFDRGRGRLGVCAEREQDARAVTRHLAPGRPETGAAGERADAAGRRAAGAGEEVLAYPAAAGLGAPVDRRVGVRLDDVQASADQHRGGARDEQARGKSALRDPVRVQPAAGVGRHEAQPALPGGPPKRIGERGPARRVERQAGRSVRVALLARPGYDAELPAAARQRDPGTVLRLDEGARPEPAVDGQPREDRSGARHPADPPETPTAAGRPTTTLRPDVYATRGDPSRATASSAWLCVGETSSALASPGRASAARAGAAQSHANLTEHRFPCIRLRTANPTDAVLWRGSTSASETGPPDPRAVAGHRRHPRPARRTRPSSFATVQA